MFLSKYKRRMEVLEQKLKTLEDIKDRQNCKNGVHRGDHQIVKDTSRIWVRCSFCYGDLSANRYVRDLSD